MQEPVIMAELWRGALLESTHRGHAVVMHRDGDVIDSWGDPAKVIFPRSSCKMIQALPLVESGAAAAAGLGPAQLALACASHQGAPMHTDRISAWLHGLGRSEADLRCGPQPPSAAADRDAMRAAGGAPGQLHNTCSGKHAGFVTLARHLDAGADYIDPDHPCRNVTGDDYVSAEQYSGFCKSSPEPKDQKVGMSNTLMGKSVTGTMTDRGESVTGNEPGTCQAVTGTPYTGAEQTKTFCADDRASMAMSRAQKGTGNVGANMTGIQPGVGGVMTGDSKGVCEPLTGTPYVGADQSAAACPATAATPANSDFPQQIGGQAWGDFSVASPAGEAQEMMANGAVTGSTYEKGNITGPFGMAGGKVTGTEQARFGGAKAPMPEPVVASVDDRLKSRVTGEGQGAGLKVTGDDWERGDHVTGTEGKSATVRNPTLRGVPGASMAASNKRNEEVALPVSKVTGASGSTEKGSLITYSGGARG